MELEPDVPGEVSVRRQDLAVRRASAPGIVGRGGLNAKDRKQGKIGLSTLHRVGRLPLFEGLGHYQPLLRLRFVAVEQFA